MPKISELPVISDLTDATAFPAFKTTTGRVTLSGIKTFANANLFPIPFSSVAGLQAELNLKQSISQKGAANGYAPLGADSRVPLANLPTSTGGVTLPIAITDVTGLASSLSSKAVSSAIGQANGIAPLDFEGKVPAANLRAVTGGITADYLTPIVSFTSSSPLNQANNHNKVMIYEGTASLIVSLEARDVGTTYRFIQLNTGALVFSGTSGGSRQGSTGPYTQPAQTFISSNNATTSAGKGSAVMAVLVKPTVWHISGALV